MVFLFTRSFSLLFFTRYAISLTVSLQECHLDPAFDTAYMKVREGCMDRASPYWAVMPSSLDFCRNCSATANLHRSVHLKHQNHGAKDISDVYWTTWVSVIEDAMPGVNVLYDSSQLNQFCLALDKIQNFQDAVDVISRTVCTPAKPAWTQLNHTRGCSSLGLDKVNELLFGEDGSSKRYVARRWREQMRSPERTAAQAYLLESLPDEFILEPPPSWYLQHLDQHLTNQTDFGATLESTFTACITSICTRQSYRGNPDIGGVGIFASLVIEAALALVMLVAFIIQEISPDKATLAPEVFSAALSTATFHALSAGVLGFYHINRSPSTYELHLYTAVTMAFSAPLTLFERIFAITQHSARPDLPSHMRWRTYLVVLANALAITIGYLANSKPYATATRSDSECYGKASRFADVLSNLVHNFIVHQIMYFLRYRDNPRLWDIMVVAPVSLLLMFDTRIHIYGIRKRGRALMGSSYGDDEWGFAQVIAIGAWAPLIVDLFWSWTGMLGLG